MATKTKRIDFQLADWLSPCSVRSGARYSTAAAARASRGLSRRRWSYWRIRKPLSVSPVCREHQKSLRESAKRNLQSMIKRLGLSSYFQVLDAEIRHRNGSMFFFAGLSTVSEEDIRGWGGCRCCVD